MSTLVIHPESQDACKAPPKILVLLYAVDTPFSCHSITRSTRGSTLALVAGTRIATYATMQRHRKTPRLIIRAKKK
jgi:hypothetical protein